MSTPVPHFSIIVPVHNDWRSIERALRALSQQIDAQAFEVILVDDGSDNEAPASIHDWNKYFPLAILRQPHSGIPVARNRGIQSARGLILVFTDADCEMQPTCLSALASAVSRFPEHCCFQLHLTGECSNLLGRAEELRLMSIQTRALQPDGRISYLNTAGFAVRQTVVGADRQLFDPLALRAEDTLLLADLMRQGQLPLFVADAIVRHRIEISWFQCIVRDIRSAWQESRTYDTIAAKGVSVRMSDAGRMELMRSMWNSARKESMGRMAWFVVVARRTVHRVIGLLYQGLRGSADSDVR